MKSYPQMITLSFTMKVHGITEGLVSASPEGVVIFQIIGEHGNRYPAGVAVCHAGSVEDSGPSDRHYFR